jgi:hypothetical protein
VCESCLAANTGGVDGTCAAVTAGADPDGECPDQGATTCESNGTGCNGNALSPDCNLYDNTTECAPQSCTGDTETAASFCNGSGSCVAGQIDVCVPYTCDLAGFACETSCTTAAECAAGYFCDSGSCSGQGSDGAACTLGTECQSGFCSDGYCCDVACAGNCEACSAALSTASSNGLCAPIIAGTDPDSNCSPGEACDGAGTCRLADGQSCSAGTECVTGNCVEGFCCDTACTAACRSCAVAGSEGTCSVAPAGFAGSPLCDPFLCDGVGAACPTTCTGDLDCVAGGYCDGNSCATKKTTGTGCANDNECTSGFCVDSVCCASACTATCQACSAAKTGGTDGTCSPIPSGSDPDGECGAGSVCNGTTSCRKIAGQSCSAANECLSGFCVDGVCCGSSCTGTCRACSAAKTGGTDGVCAFVPAGDDPDGECQNKYSCDGSGTCRQDDGESCVLGTECVTGLCVDGVCCNLACSGVCEACAQSKTGGTDGVCASIPHGDDPDSECGTTTCNGVNGCQKTDGSLCTVGPECQSGNCADGYCCDTSCAAACRACNVSGSEGVCSLSPQGSPGSPLCNPYVCDGVNDACPSSCSTSADCAASSYCNGVTCVPRQADGQACSLGEECLSNQCTDGVCCNLVCGGTCVSCLGAYTGDSDGVCAFINAGTDPEAECSGGQTCNGAGVCSTKADGQPCAASSECSSLQCVDGVCCDEACAGVCEACVATKTGGTDGVCAPVTANTDPDNECPTTDDCDGFGACQQGIGSPCTADSQCVSGHCADGYCCFTACTSSCNICNLTGFEGTCTVAPQGTAGDPSCDPFVCDGSSTLCPSSCTGDGDCAASAYCDGAVCQPKKADGVACVAGNECLSDSCADAVCCDATCGGVCEACTAALTGGADGVCAPIPASADPEAECGAGSLCDGAGVCRLDDGQSCAVNSECLTGFCVDSFCCATACNQTCEACSAAKTGGANGICALIPSGDDPDLECGTGGVCDGAGSCLLGDGELCTAPGDCLSGFCVDGVCCDVVCSGTCLACTAALTGGSDGACAFVTPGTDPDGDCGANAACDATGTCKKSDGELCAGNAECASDVCIDGVCCDVACGGTCEACVATKTGGADGVCTPIPAGDDPDGECGLNESCNGLAACAKDDGQSCGAPTECVSGFCVDGYCCDTICDGSCRACSATLTGGTDGVCAQVLEGTDPDDDCPGVQTCNAVGGCGTDPDGTPCSDGSTCLSGRCVDGVCCNTLCDGTCQSCVAVDTGGTDGTCAPVTFGTDPVPECLANERCDGVGACKKVDGETCAAGTECLSTSCADSVCCDTDCTGTCESCLAGDTGGTTGVCDFVTSGLDPAGECAGGVCNGAGECKLPDGAACSSGTQCVSGFCVDGVCCDGDCTGTCQACSATKTGGTDGVCDFVTASTDPDLECTGGDLCDGAGACRSPVGASCGVPTDCLNDNCIDGFCCDTACGGTCEACSALLNGGADGTCGPIPFDTDPEGECASNERCDGASACKLVVREACSVDGDCLNDMCRDGFCCETDCGGTCRACNAAWNGGTDGVCGDIIPGTDPDNECPASRVCQEGAICGDLILGQSCGADNECDSRNCVDGVCCDSDCSSLCASCIGSQTGGDDGTCAFITSGTDPANECANNEACDGSGVCKYVDGEVCTGGGECLSGFCPSPDGVCCDAACDGLCEACLGSLTGGSDGSCDYIPVGQDPEDECVDPATCSGVGTCEKGLGEPCTVGTECGSGFCADGFCCNNDCSGTCESCAAVDTGGTDGTCDFVLTGTDPEDECPGIERECNGAGECKTLDGGSCTTDDDCFSGACPGDDGVCCNTACSGTCAACVASKTGGTDGTCGFVTIYTDPDDECTGATSLCNGGGECRNDDGVGCGAGTECVSDYCTDGVCCNTPCDTGECEACSAAKTGGTDGVCSAITAYTDPDGDCAAGDLCDGAFACKHIDGETCGGGSDCLSTHCVDNVCCADACTGECRACSQAKTGLADGICNPITGGTDPDAECVAYQAPCGGELCNGDSPTPACEAVCDDCDQVYTHWAINYHCSQHYDRCRINIASSDRSCATVCSAGGGTCLDFRNDDPNDSCNGASSSLSCNDTSYGWAICTCSRQP